MQGIPTVVRALWGGGEYASVEVSTTVGLSVQSKELLWVDNGK